MQEINAEPNGGLYHVTLSIDEECENSLVVFLQTEDSWLSINKIDNSHFDVTVSPIGEDIKEDRSGQIKTIANGKECTDFFIDVTQRALDCECSAFSFTPSINGVPQEGLENGSVIFRYSTIQCGCRPTPIKAKLGEHTITVAGGQGTLNGAIEPNYGVDSKTFTFFISYGSEDNYCLGPTDYVQEGCDCQSFEFKNYITEINQEGLPKDSVIFEYSIKDEGCIINKVNAKLDNQNLNLEGGYATIPNAIEPNNNINDNTFNLSITYEGSESPCFTTGITQPGLGCDCNRITAFTWIYDEDNPVPVEGLGSGQQIAEYNLLPTECEGYAATLVDENGETYPVTWANGKITLVNGIPERTWAGDLTFTATVTFKGDECKRTTFSQEGIECGCEQIVLSIKE